MRKIIQIAPIPYTEAETETLYALCSDGSVWRLPFPRSHLPSPRDRNATSADWLRVPGIPDPEVAYTSELMDEDQDEE